MLETRSLQLPLQWGKSYPRHCPHSPLQMSQTPGSCCSWWWYQENKAPPSCLPQRHFGSRFPARPPFKTAPQSISLPEKGDTLGHQFFISEAQLSGLLPLFSPIQALPNSKILAGPPWLLWTPQLARPSCWLPVPSPFPASGERLFSSPEFFF